MLMRECDDDASAVLGYAGAHAGQTGGPVHVDCIN